MSILVCLSGWKERCDFVHLSGKSFGYPFLGWFPALPEFYVAGFAELFDDFRSFCFASRFVPRTARALISPTAHIGFAGCFGEIAAYPLWTVLLPQELLPRAMMP